MDLIFHTFLWKSIYFYLVFILFQWRGRSTSRGHVSPFCGILSIIRRSSGSSGTDFWFSSGIWENKHITWESHTFFLPHSSKGQFGFFVDVAFAYQQLKIPPPTCLLRHDMTPRHAVALINFRENSLNIKSAKYKHEMKLLLISAHLHYQHPES